MGRINRQTLTGRDRVCWRRRIAAAGAGAVLAAGMVVAAAGPAAAGGPPVLAFSPSPHDYGQVTLGQTASQTFTLANSGGSASAVLTVALSGSAAFTITADSCTATSLGPEKSCTVTVQFAPATSACAAAATASLTATGEKPAARAMVSLSGTGAAAPHLYWATFGGTIVEANLNGSSPQAIVSNQDEPRGLAVG